MVRPVRLRQGKDLSKNLREALRFFLSDTHHIADVAQLKFCLLLRLFLVAEARATPLPRHAFYHTNGISR